MPADRGRASDRRAGVSRDQRAREHADAQHLLPVHVAAHHPGRGLLHAQQAVLRPLGHDPAVRSGGHHLQHLDHRTVAVGRWQHGAVWLRDPSPRHVALFRSHLSRGPSGRARRLRGDPRQRDPLHRRLRRVVAQRRCHRGNVLHNRYAVYIPSNLTYNLIIILKR